MVEVKETGKEGSVKTYGLFIDGKLVASVIGIFVRQFSLDDSDTEAYNALSIQSFSEIKLSGWTIALDNLPPSLRWWPYPKQTSIGAGGQAGEYAITFTFYGSASRWNHPWTFTEYKQQFKSEFEASGFPGEVREDENPDNEFIADMMPTHITAFIITKTTRRMGEELDRLAKVIKHIHELTETRLITRLREHSVALQFDFPEEVRIPCEQYLLYFAQFLRDLGVQADTALTHEAGQVLFTVTPEDKDQALDKIRAALEVYIHLPSSPVSDAGGNEIAVLRLNSELQSLQSKFSLARAEMQMKDAAIQLQKVTIAQLTGEVVFESLKDVTPKPKDKEKEELLGDIVSLVPIKGKGFEVNLPELLRRLKQLFKKEE